jgi:hydroxymethylpyrimidine/phosphomethylpyrimidine kinase
MTIAGFDPCGVVGVLADLKTFAAHACYGVAAITAITVQNMSGEDDIHPVQVDVLQACLGSLLADASVKAIKIGLLGTRANAAAVLELLETTPPLPVVLDPLVTSASGYGLDDATGFELMRDRLLPHVNVITPNLPGAAALTGLKVENLEEMKAAARKLIAMGARAVVVTGGHLDRPIDVFADGSSVKIFAGDPVKPGNIRGAGCTFSSALAANLAHGRPLADAVVLAKAYVTEAIKKACAVGLGRVPLNHFYRMQETHRQETHRVSDSSGGVVKPGR